MRVAIISGTGAFGSWYARFFKKKGFEVAITSRDPERGKAVSRELGVKLIATPEEAAAWADITVIATPIAVAPEMISLLAPRLRKGALLTDLASVKGKVCKTYARIRRRDIETASIHPMHGPVEESVVGRPVLFIPVRVGEKYAALKELFAKEGARVIECECREHDGVLAVVQGLTHFIALASAAAIKELGVDFGKTNKFASPTYERLMSLVSRVVCQNPSLYAQIQVENPANKKARRIFLREARKMAAVVEKGGTSAIEGKIGELADFFCGVRK
ncbi:MAG: prephenate dehydrogenase/arogenate dehydrogenase family protein [Candidatus Micrarchaeota archaeon]|nr:prephenate dehydrogenase/arogenate dehydrogenase family protein [Candidatus Micrarchaeota archaeon]